jgi:hypothetical protein
MRSHTTRGKYSALVWKLAIDFEEAAGSFLAAKQLVYRAIATLGSVKGQLQSCFFID